MHVNSAPKQQRDGKQLTEREACDGQGTDKPAPLRTVRFESSTSSTRSQLKLRYSCRMASSSFISPLATALTLSCSKFCNELIRRQAFVLQQACCFVSKSQQPDFARHAAAMHFLNRWNEGLVLSDPQEPPEACSLLTTHTVQDVARTCTCKGPHTLLQQVQALCIDRQIGYTMVT